MIGFSIFVRFFIEFLSSDLMFAFWSFLFVICGLFLLYKILMEV